jgi:endoglucanase
MIASGLAAGDSAAVIRVNQIGYLPGAPKVAVVCALERVAINRFTVETASGRIVVGPTKALPSGPFGPCVETWRLDFSALRTRGSYRLRAGAYVSPLIRIAPDVYVGLADTLMGYMRQQRSGYNPFLRDSAHTRDGIIVDHPTRTGEHINVSGGWADAADYLHLGDRDLSLVIGVARYPLRIRRRVRRPRSSGQKRHP